MATADAVLAWARAQLGTIEAGGPDGRSGNIVRYWAEIGLPQDQGEPWCDAFCSDAFLATKAGVPVMVYCPTSEAWYRQHGRLYGPDQAQPGDQGFAAWKSGGVAPGHTWIVEANDPANRRMTTIEGNTQPGAAGDQSNGGGVYRRVRTYAECRSVGRPPYDLAAPPAPATSPIARFDLDGVPTMVITVTIPTDSNGCGWLPPLQGVDAAKMVAVTVQGSHPGIDGAYWPGSAHWQDRDGHPLVSVTAASPNSKVNVFVAAAA